MRLTGLQCPSCGASEMVHGKDQQLTCVYCGTSYGEVTRICPDCGYYNEPGVRHCAECGTAIIRDCPACGWDNWVLAEHCVQCGRNMDVIDKMARRWKQTTQQRLEERRAGVAELKEKEERASQQRMAEFLEAERRRQEALAEAREAQQRRDQQMYVLIGVAIVILTFFVILAIVLAVVGS
jgi:Double zinc ribbon